MSPEDMPKMTEMAQDYARIWAECTAKALGQLQGGTFTPAAEAPPAKESIAPAAPAVADSTPQPVPSPAEQEATKLEPPNATEAGTLAEEKPESAPAASEPSPRSADTAEPTATEAAATPVSGTDAGPAAEPSAATPPEIPARAAELILPFKVSGRLTGEQAFQITKSDGVRLAQMLMAEPLDPSAELSEGHADALNEIFRQFAGLAATACKPIYGGEVSFALDPGRTPEWKEEAAASWGFTAPQIPVIHWTLLINAELRAALEKAVQEKSAAAAPAASAPAPPVSGPPSAQGQGTTPSPKPTAPVDINVPEGGGTGANLDLLLDVVLEATLRFGQREMLLRDILELRPGSVVELNRRIQEPAELLVAGRVIAHGEVVIVDGNYGLRVTDVAHPQQRLESVET